MNSLQRLKEFIDSNPNVQLTIKQSYEELNFPQPRGKYTFWLTGYIGKSYVGKNGDTRLYVNCNGDDLFENFDTSIESLLIAAKSQIGKE